MNLADLEGDPRTATGLRYAVYVMLALGFGACLAVGAGRPSDPRLVQPPPTTTVAPATQPPAPQP